MEKSSVPLYWRLQKSKYRLVGTKCNTCKELYFPQKTLCPKCRRKGKLEDYKFSGKGRIITHTIIRVPPSDFEKQCPYGVAIIQLEEGPKISGQISDGIEKIETGKSVKATFRKIYEDGPDGIIHYGMKWQIVE